MKGLWLAFLLLGLTAWASPPGVPLCERPHAVAPTVEQPFPEEVRRVLDALVRAELAREPHTGLAVGVLRGEQRWVGAYGLRDVARGLPATPRTTWRMASITKSFTAVAMLQLVERGLIDLDADIRTLVSSWPEKRWPVTVRQLLGHLGGVTNYGRFGPSHDSGPVDTAGALALVAGYELEAEPGTRFIYSTWAYNLLGAAIEAVSGQSYGEYLQEHVFGPAGMVHAALDDRRTRDEHHATGYRLRDGQRVASKVIDVSGRFAGGGIRASIEDLLGFGGALLDYRLVSRTSTGRMQTPMSTRDGRLTDYGMGFATWPLRGHYVVAHSGAQPETSTLLLLLPGEDVAIALASNVEGQAASLRRIAYGIIQLLLEGEGPRLNARLQDSVDAVVNEGLNRVFGYGLAYHQWATRGPGTLPGTGGLPESFDRVAGLLDRTAIARAPNTARERILAAHEPREDWLFVRVGAHMARTLEEALGPERLRSYSARGPLAFFNDYLAVCESKSCPDPFRFNEALRADLRRFTAGAGGTHFQAAGLRGSLSGDLIQER
ncbi:serine hydrolase domain-containing protein [Archangium sp.]|uniref:serine hydrolase domain-containing protein n=1 Tax=Archangium sp. TaxID=1872627 RepID=UPI002D414BD2|nr:serine hydrolase domain-containing protein [Archangium sp.]HYO54728.1 serine hydrolase domain-containing protein [Archangium sp.]